LKEHERNLLLLFNSFLLLPFSSRPQKLHLPIPAHPSIFAPQVIPNAVANKTVNVGLVQLFCTGNPTENMQKTTAGIRAAAQKGAQVVVLQELFRSLYFCDVEDYANFNLAEAIPGPSTETLGALAKELGVVIVASLFEKRAEGLYHNTTAGWNLPR
jgi:hypothetical protein